jgi:hypothetical protein
MGKKCSNCKIDKPLSEFYIRNRNKNTYKSQCKECVSKWQKKYNQENKKEISEKKKIYHKLIDKKRKQYYIDNIETIKEYKKNYNIKNKNKISENKKKYRIDNLETLKLKHKKYYKDNKDKYIENIKNYYENNKEKIKNRNKIYYKENKDKLNKSKRDYYEKNIHAFIWRKLLKRTLHQFKNNKTDSTYNLLGYTCDELRTHIENQFTEQMSWSNYGEWHVDHIKHVCTFDKNTHPSIVNALSNLRPLWAVNTEINGIFYEGNLNRKIIKNYV